MAALFGATYGSSYQPGNQQGSSSYMAPDANGKYGGAGSTGENLYGNNGPGAFGGGFGSYGPGPYNSGLGGGGGYGGVIPNYSPIQNPVNFQGGSSPAGSSSGGGQSNQPPSGWPSGMPWSQPGSALIGSSGGGGGAPNFNSLIPANSPTLGGASQMGLAGGGVMPSSSQGAGAYGINPALMQSGMSAQTQGASLPQGGGYDPAQLAQAVATAQQALGSGRQSMGLPQQFYPSLGSLQQQMQQLSSYAQPNYSVTNTGAAAAGGYAKGGPVKGFDSGGSLDDAPSVGEGAASQGNQPPPMPALPPGNQPSATPPPQGVIPSSPAAAAPAPAAMPQPTGGAVNPQALKEYLAGAGAIAPEQAAALEQQVDPPGQMPENVRRTLAIANAAPDMRFGLMQHHRQRFNMLKAFAHTKLHQGNLLASTHAANRAYSHVPYVGHIHFSPASAGVHMQYSPIGGGRAHYMLAIAGRGTRVDQGLLAKGKEAYGKSKPQKAHAQGGLVKGFAGGGLESVMNIAAQPQRDMSEIAQAPQPQTDPSELAQAPQPGMRANPQAQQSGRATWELAQAPQQGGRAIAQAPQPQVDLPQLQMAGKGPRPENMGLTQSINSFDDGGGVPPANPDQDTDTNAVLGAMGGTMSPENATGTAQAGAQGVQHMILSIPQYEHLLNSGYDKMMEKDLGSVLKEAPQSPSQPGAGSTIPQQSSATKPASQGSSTTANSSGSTSEAGAPPNADAPISGSQGVIPSSLEAAMPGQMGPYGSKNVGQLGDNPDLLSPTPADEQQGSSKNAFPTPLTAAERASNNPEQVAVLPSNPSGSDIINFNKSNGGRQARQTFNQNQWVRTSPYEWQSMSQPQYTQYLQNKALANPRTAGELMREQFVGGRLAQSQGARSQAMLLDRMTKLRSQIAARMYAADNSTDFSNPAIQAQINNQAAAIGGWSPQLMQQILAGQPQINQSLIKSGTSAAAPEIRYDAQGRAWTKGPDGRAVPYTPQQ